MTGRTCGCCKARMSLLTPAVRAARSDSERIEIQEPGRRVLSADWWGVHQSASVPKFVDAAIETQWREVTVEALAIIPHLSDDVVSPAIIQPEHFAELALGADEALDDGIVAFCLLINILRREP